MQLIKNPKSMIHSRVVISSTNEAGKLDVVGGEAANPMPKVMAQWSAAAHFQSGCVNR
jgi:hypothetical protein